jgi:hypothetical protein
MSKDGATFISSKEDAMKTIVAILLLAAPLCFSAAPAQSAEPRAVRLHLDVQNPIAHVAQLQRAARALEHAEGVARVDIFAAQGDLRVTWKEDAETGIPELVQVIEAEGFRAHEAQVAVR